MKVIFIVVFTITLSLENYATSDCFQEVSKEIDVGSIPGFSESGDIEQLSITVLDNLQQCLGLSGKDLYNKIVENFLAYKTGKIAGETERLWTWMLLKSSLFPPEDKIRVLLPKRFTGNNQEKQIITNQLAFMDTMGNGPFDIDFMKYKKILTQENIGSQLALSILDYMFTLSAGQALIELNNNLDSQSIDQLKMIIKPLVELHLLKSPDLWPDEELELSKVAINALISSNYAYIDLFIAEIVNVVHDLRTPEVDAFLAQSIQPLVIKRLQNPYVYEPLVK